MHTWASLKNSFYLDAWFFDIATREQNTHRNAFNKSIYGHVCSFVNLLKIIVTLYSSAIISHWGIIIYLDTFHVTYMSLGCMSFEIKYWKFLSRATTLWIFLWYSSLIFTPYVLWCTCWLWYIFLLAITAMQKCILGQQYI